MVTSTTRSVAPAIIIRTSASASLLEGDDSAIDAALAQMSALLLRHLADRVSASAGSGADAGQSVLRLHFEH